MSVWTHWNSGPRRCSMFFSEPVSRLSTHTTRWPRSSRCSQRWEPRKPAPPVTRHVAIRWSVPTEPSVADREVRLETGELERPHHGRAGRRQPQLEAPLVCAVVEPDQLLEAGRVHEHHVTQVDGRALPGLGRSLERGAEIGDRAQVELAGELDGEGVPLDVPVDLEQHLEVPPAGFEPATRCLEGSRSVH